MSMKQFLQDVVRNFFGANFARRYDQVGAYKNANCTNYFTMLHINICLPNFLPVCVVNYCVNSCITDMERPKRSRPPVGSYAEDFPPVTSLDTSDDSESADDYFDSEDDNIVVEDRYEKV